MDGIFSHKNEKKKTFGLFIDHIQVNYLPRKKNIPEHLRSLERMELLTLKKMSTKSIICFIIVEKKNQRKIFVRVKYIAHLCHFSYISISLNFFSTYFSLSPSILFYLLLSHASLLFSCQVWILGLRHVTKHIKKCVHNLLTTLQSIFNPPSL